MKMCLESCGKCKLKVQRNTALPGGMAKNDNKCWWAYKAPQTVIIAWKIKIVHTSPKTVPVSYKESHSYALRK